MDLRSDVRDFLTSRRNRLTPEQAGVPTYGEARRVSGLRRGEVAQLAGVSIEYYTRLERGNLSGVSESVLQSLSRALQLDEAEHAHLFDLARAATGGYRAPVRRSAGVRPSVLRILENLGTPGYVRNTRLDVLAANELCYGLYANLFTRETLPWNMARLLFLDPVAQDFFLDWATVADDTAAALRIEAGRRTSDKPLSDLIGELATHSDAFSTRWARHNVRLHRTGRKRIANPIVGKLDLTADSLELPGEDLTLIAYTAAPDSPDQEKLDFLSRWSHAAARPEGTAAEIPTELTGQQ